MLIILLVAAVLIIANGIIGYFIRRMLSKTSEESSLKSFSIIVAAKNEAENIESLLASLIAIDYPSELFEVIVIDDNSEDNTYKILSNKINHLNNFNVYKLDQEKCGKRNALELGISKSLHPYILITDADCKPENNWLKAYSKKFEEDYDFLFGIAPFFREKSLTNKISCFENLKSSILTFFTAEIGLPHSAAARNFGFKKSSFEKIEKYSKTNDTLSGDDDLLLREALKNNQIIGTVTEKKSFVFSKTKQALGEYFKQRARQTQSSFYYLLKQKLMIGSWYVFNLFFLFSPILFFVNFYFVFMLPIKLCADLILILIFQNRFGYKFTFIEVLYLQIFYELFLIVHFFNAKLGRIEWK